MSKNLTAPKKASRRTPFRLHCNHFAPSVLSGGTGKRAIGKPCSLSTHGQTPRESSGAAPKTRKQAGGQGYAGIRSGKVFLKLGPLVLFFDLHSRREDFNPVFARHSDGDSSARAPSRAIVTATPPELVTTAPSSTGVS